MRIFILVMVLYGVVSSPVVAESGVLDVDWSKLNNTRGQVSARRTPYPKVLTHGIREVTLPVYLPASLAYHKEISVVADKNFYTLTLKLKGATLITSGDRTYQQSIQDSPQFKEMVPTSSVVSFIRAEGMMTTDFSRLGANYSLELECEKPDQDNRCLQEEFLKGLYQELILVGGHS